MTNCTKICTSKEKESWERERVGELGEKKKKEEGERVDLSFNLVLWKYCY